MTDNGPSRKDGSHFFDKERHVRFFASALHQLPAPYAKLDTNRLTMIHFAVHALDVFGVWDDDDDGDDNDLEEDKGGAADCQQNYQLVDAERILNWILDCLVLKSRGGFVGGTHVGPMGDWITSGTTTEADDGKESLSSLASSASAASAEFCSRMGPNEHLTFYHQPHIAMTYCALLTIHVLQSIIRHKSSKTANDDILPANASANANNNDQEDEWDDRLPPKSKILEHLRSLQRPNGSFACTMDPASEHDLRFLYCACVISYLLQDWSGIDIDLSVQYIQDSFDVTAGGIALVPGQEGHGGSTFCGVASLLLMGRLDQVLASNPGWEDQLIHWCVHRQQQQRTSPDGAAAAGGSGGGMQGRPNKLEDSCYSYWIGGTLRLLDHQDVLLDRSALQQFLFSCQSPPNVGGFAKAPGGYPDMLHSFYSIAWLSLSNEYYGHEDGDTTTKLEDPSVSQRLPLHRLNATLGIRQDRAEEIHRHLGCPRPFP